jgi:hypothetical protein
MQHNIRRCALKVIEAACTCSLGRHKQHSMLAGSSSSSRGSSSALHSITATSSSSSSKSCS